MMEEQREPAPHALGSLHLRIKPGIAFQATFFVPHQTLQSVLAAVDPAAAAKDRHDPPSRVASTRRRRRVVGDEHFSHNCASRSS